MSIESVLDDIAAYQDRRLILDRLIQCKESSVSPVDLLNVLLRRIQSGSNSIELCNYVFTVGLFCTLAKSWSSVADSHIRDIVMALRSCLQSEHEGVGMTWVLLSSCSRLLTLTEPERGSDLHSEMLSIALSGLRTRTSFSDDETMLCIKSIQYVDQVASFLPELLCKIDSAPDLFSSIFDLMLKSDHAELIWLAAQCTSKFLELSIADFTHPGLRLVEPNWFNDTDEDSKIDECHRQELEQQLLAFQKYDVSGAFKSLIRMGQSDPESSAVFYFLALLSRAQDPDNCCIAEISRYCFEEVLRIINDLAIHRKKSLRNQASQWIKLMGDLIPLHSAKFRAAAFDDLQALHRELHSRNLLLASIRHSLNLCFSRFLLSNPSADDSALESALLFCLDSLACPILASDCALIARDNRKLLASIVDKARNVICLALEDKRQETAEQGLEAAGRIACYLSDFEEPIIAQLSVAVHDLLDRSPSPIALLSAVRLITHGPRDHEQIVRLLSKCIDLALLRSCFDRSDDDETDSDTELQIASLLALKSIFSCDIITLEMFSRQKGIVNDFVNELVLAPCIFEDDVQVRLLTLDVIAVVAGHSAINSCVDWKSILNQLQTAGKDADIGQVLDGSPLQDLISTITSVV